MSSNFPATNAGGYEMLMGRWSRQLAEPFLDFAGPAAGPRVIDVGCGTGSLTRVLLARRPQAQIVAVDVSAPFVAHAQATIVDPRATFRVCDATALDSESGSFDEAISLLVLNFVPEYRNAISEMVRVTRPGGRVSAAVWDLEGGQMLSRIVWDTAAALDQEASTLRGKSLSAPLIREGELAAAMRDAGLTDVEAHDILFWMRFTSFEDYWVPFTQKQASLGVYIGGLDETRKSKLKDAVYAAYCAGRSDGARTYAAVARAAKGIVPQS